MLSIDQVSVAYGDRIVLAGLDLELVPGRVHGLVGRNGSGKTTLLEAMYGFLPLRTGTILLDGVRLSPRNAAYLPVENHFYPKITGREYLRIFQSRSENFDLSGWSSIFELPLDRFIDDYSTGMKRKLALMGTLSLQRTVVLLDEPMNGLDVESNLLLLRLCRSLAESGRIVLVTSHILESLTSACDLIHVLDQGRILRTVPRSEFHTLESHFFTHESEDKLARLHTLILQGDGKAP